MDLQQSSQRSSVAQLETGDTIVSQLAQKDNVPWYNKPNLRLLYVLMAPTCLGVELTSGFDASMVNGLQAVPSWLEYYHHPRSASLGLMASTYSLGSLVAAPFVSPIADKFGRRYSILLGGVISIVGAIIQGSASSFVMFIIARFLLGVANVFCIVAAASLIGELSHPKERGTLGSLFNVSYDLGAVAAAGVTLGTFAMTSNWGWRIPSFLQVVPSLLQVSFIWFLPESPRWLVSKGRNSEAHAFLVKYHAEGDEDSEFVMAEYTQIVETLEAELKITQMNQRDALSTPGMRKRIVIASLLGLFTQCSGSGLISYYFSPTLDSIGIHDNWTKNIINLLKYPRRWTFLVCTISLFIILVAWTAASAKYSFTHDNVSACAVLVLIFLYSPAYNIGLNALPYVYLVELFPYYVRARGLALYQWACRGGGFLNQFGIPIGLDLAGWRFYIIYCVWSALQVMIVYHMFPETSGHTLEELTFLYEDEQEVLMHGGVRALHDHGETETYGTIVEE